MIKDQSERSTNFLNWRLTNTRWAGHSIYRQKFGSVVAALVRLPTENFPSRHGTDSEVGYRVQELKGRIGSGMDEGLSGIVTLTEVPITV